MDKIEQKIEQNTGKLSLKYLRNVFLTIIVISLIFGSGYFLGIRNFYVNLYGYPEVHIERELPSDKKDLDFALFWTVWDKLNEKYFDKDKLVSAKMVYGAIKGMVSSLSDPYTVFLPPFENKIVQEDLKGSFDGVGIQLGYRKEWITVIAPVSDSPAERAGVKAGDVVYGIRDDEKNINIENTQGLSIQEAVSVIRGKKGKSVFITFVREGVEKPFEMELVRDTLDIPSVELTMVGGKGDIAHIRVNKFAGETKVEWDAKVVELQTRDSSGIILDLRNNPGGYLMGAVELGTDFMDQGEVVVIEEQGDKNRTEYKVEGIGRLKNRKVIVLVNEGSASASEILAGALRDNKKFKLVGQTTFGKGTIQEPEELEDGVGLHITIAKWLTPDGTWVNEKGLKPDIEVADNPGTEIDEQLEAAIAELQK